MRKATVCSILLPLSLPHAAASLPNSFEPNTGQADSRVQCLARGKGYTLFLAAVQAFISRPPLEVLYAGPQGEFTGLDQVNILLPAAPVVRGVRTLDLSIDGRFANPVLIHLK